MALEQSKVDQLVAFKQREKFSVHAWNDRGLNPSSADISSRLTHLFNRCADALIEAVYSNASDKQIKAVLKTHLSKLNSKDFDTEEREFVCDLFYELAQILNIDFADNVSRWLYGSTLSTLLKIQAAFNPRKVLETRSQNCQKCGAALETFIISKEQGIPDYCWNVVQCKSCKDFSLVSIGPGIKEVRFGNYDLVEQLPKAEFTKEQAEIRLEQLRHFRR